MKYWVVGALILILDQVSKITISSFMLEGTSMPIIRPILYLTYVLNQGAAFGLFSNQPLLLLAAGLLAVALVWYYRNDITKQNSMVKWGVTLATAGALGNLIDRIRIGAVIDFIDVVIWPVFNVADIVIVIGVILLFWEVFTYRKVS